MTKQIKQLKYHCISPEIVSQISNIYKDHRVAEHIEDLYSLIEYQLKEIHAKRSKDIAEKHHVAWKQYKDK